MSTRDSVLVKTDFAARVDESPQVGPILLISDEPTTIRSLRELITTDLRQLAITSTSEALKRLHCEPSPDLLFLDLLPETDDLDVFHQLRRVCPELKIVILTSPNRTKQVVEAIRLGADDYLMKPVQQAELELVLNRYSALSARAGSESVEKVNDDLSFVAASPVMQQVRMQVKLVADVDAPVLLLGESGTGKEVTAKLIHKLSPRSTSRFLKVNCAAFPSELLESELFGYERGAFTGAIRTKIGKFELCDKGTILLDEIGELPTALQAKLLHVLQDNQFCRLGGNETIEVDVRILAATNVDVRQAIADRRLREDVYYRLSAFTIQLPPLRARGEEIPLLLDHFMHRSAIQYSRSPRPFSSVLLEACLRYDWPGNLRELENFVRRYLVVGDEAIAISELQSRCEDELDVKNCVAPLKGHGSVTISPGNGERPSLKSTVRSAKDGAERRALTQALEEASWNRKQAARILKISYRALLYKIQQHRLSPFNRSASRVETAGRPTERSSYKHGI